MRDESLPINQVIVGDVLDVLRTLPDECVDCVVTSPPYWGLRDYGVEGQIGLEATPEEFVAKMVEVFREVRRVLAGHGTCWVNLGSSYCSGTDANRKPGNGDCASWTTRNQPQRTASVGGFKPKDMVPIPWMVALALQADGWWLRQDIIWFKANPMPESVTDRCTKAHEYVFLLTKRPRYWYDAEAVKEKCDSGPSDMRKMLEGKERIGGKHKVLDDRLSKASMYTNIGQKRSVGDPSGRNRRSVWSIPTQPMPEAHFATYPEKLVEPCILAGCPREVCRVCGKPRERVVEKSGGTTGKSWHDHSNDLAGGMSQYDPTCQKGGVGKAKDANGQEYKSTTIGWTDCGHGDYRPGIVLDPFGGSGTTGVVAAKLKRDYILIELNERYANDIARPRLAHVETGVTVTEQRAGQLPLFAGKRKENQ